MGCLRRGSLGQNLESHLVACDLGDPGLCFRPMAVEDGEEIADALAHDLRAVVGLLGIEKAAIEGG